MYAVTLTRSYFETGETYLFPTEQDAQKFLRNKSTDMFNNRTNDPEEDWTSLKTSRSWNKAVLTRKVQNTDPKTIRTTHFHYETLTFTVSPIFDQTNGKPKED